MKNSIIPIIFNFIPLIILFPDVSTRWCFPICRPFIIVPPNRVNVNLRTACDGDEAFAGCINGLCGQGFVCNRIKNLCCKCPSGKVAVGPCIGSDQTCPAGSTCNLSNNMCCRNK